MTWVKLCGMRNDADVVAAAAAGADAVGFVIAAGSPRRVSPAQAAEAGASAPELGRFLVTVDFDAGSLLAAAAAARVTGVQPHGVGSAAAAVAALEAGYDVLFPVPVDADVDLAGVPAGAIPILDTAIPGRHGGTGVTFRWTVAAGATDRFVIAGGLTPDNVAAAVAASGAWGVDVSSGIEREQGIKDPELMRRFVEAVR